MKWKPVAVWAAAIVSVLVLVSIAALKIFVSPESVAMLVIPRIEQAFQRDVTYQAVDLSYFPRLGVKFKEIEIKNAEPFTERPLARIAGINANIGLLSLLKGDPQIDELVVSGWEMLLQVDSLGRRNFTSTDTSTVSDTLPLPQVSDEPLCNEFRLDGGRLLYRNDSTDVRLVLAGIELSYSLDGELAERFQGQLKVDSLLARNQWMDLRVSDEAAEATFEGTYLSSADSIAVRKCTWRIDAFSGRLDGRASRLRSLPSYAFHFISERTVIADAKESNILGLIPSFDRLKAEGNLRMEVSLADSASDAQPPLVRGEVNLTDFSFTVPGNDITAQIRFAEANFNQRSLSLYTEGAAIGSTPALLRFTVDDFSDPTYSGEINLVGDAAVLLGILGVPDQVEVGGYVDAALSGFIRPSEIEAGRLFGSLIISGLSYRDSLNAVGIDELSLESRFVGNSVDVPNLTLAVGGDTLSLTGNVSEFPLAFARGISSLRRPQLDFRLASTSFNFDTLTTLNSVPILGEADTSNVLLLVDRILDFNAVGELAIDTGRFWGVDFTNLDARMSVVNRIVYSDSARAHAFGGILDGEVVLDFASLLEPELEMELRAIGIEAKQYLDYYTSLGGSVSGRVDLNYSLNSRGLGGTLLRRTLAMRGSLTMADGLVRGLPIADAFRSELGIEAFYRDRVGSLAGDFIVANETLRFNRLAFDSGPIRYSVMGSVSLAGEVALDVNRTLEPDEIKTLSRLPDARSLMPRNPRYGIFRITGAEDRYRIAIDSFR